MVPRNGESVQKDTLKERLCIFRGEILIFLQSCVEFVDGLVTHIKRTNPTTTLMFWSAIFALGWFVTLCINPRFFADSSYLYPVDRMGLTGYIRAVFGLLGAVQLTTWYLVRHDLSPSRRDLPDDSPHRSINRPLNYWLCVTGFLVGGVVWFITGGMVNLSLLITNGKAPSPQTPFYVVECILSITWAFVCTSNYNKSRRRRAEMTLPPNTVVTA